MIKPIKDFKSTYPSVAFDILRYLNQDGAFIHPVLIEEELKRNRINYDGNLNNLLDKMAGDKLLEPKLAKSTGDILYRINERGRKLFLREL